MGTNLQFHAVWWTSTTKQFYFKSNTLHQHDNFYWCIIHGYHFYIILLVACLWYWCCYHHCGTANIVPYPSSLQHIMMVFVMLSLFIFFAVVGLRFRDSSSIRKGMVKETYNKKYLVLGVKISTSTTSTSSTSFRVWSDVYYRKGPFNIPNNTFHL
jgi:hypothetical protein